MSSSWGDIPSWAYESSQVLMQSLKFVDPLTYEHCCRVGEFSRLLARDAGLNEYEQKQAAFAGLFHDIGKIGIGASILQKPSRLDEVEYEMMKTHSVLSEDIIKPLTTHKFFHDLAPAVRGHHERMDGQGYPDKKRGDEIPLLARVILIVDTFDAMTQDRPYRKGLPLEVMYAELKKYAGTQFDEQLVRIFLEAHKTWGAADKDKDQDSLHLLLKQVA